MHLTTLRSTTAWRETLLLNPLDHAMVPAIPDFLKQVGQDFIGAMPLILDATSHAELDIWYESSDGQEALVAFTQALGREMSEVSAHAMPGHDARHAMHKVPAAALEYMQAEGVEGWQRVGVLGGLLHDYGRWAEERIWGEPGDSLIHARLSFLLGRELLAAFDMPRAVKEHILLAALRHTSGAGPEDPLPLKLTVTADRDQLYGPEVILRLFHHAPAHDGALASFSQPGRSVLDKMYRFLRTRLPGPLFSRGDHVDSLWWTLARFILMCESEDASRARFTSPTPLVQRGFDWDREWRLARDAIDPHADLEKAARALLSAAHVAPNACYVQGAIDRVSAAPETRHAAIASALGFANQARIAEDSRQLNQLRHLRRAHSGDRMVGALLGLLLENSTAA